MDAPGAARRCAASAPGRSRSPDAAGNTPPPAEVEQLGPALYRQLVAAVDHWLAQEYLMRNSDATDCNLEEWSPCQAESCTTPHAAAASRPSCSRFAPRQSAPSRAIRLDAERARSGVNFDEVDEDDWQWPEPAAALCPTFSSMNQGRVLPPLRSRRNRTYGVPFPRAQRQHGPPGRAGTDDRPRF